MSTATSRSQRCLSPETPHIPLAGQRSTRMSILTRRQHGGITSPCCRQVGASLRRPQRSPQGYASFSESIFCARNPRLVDFKALSTPCLTYGNVVTATPTACWFSVDVPYGYLWDMKAREVSTVNSDTVSEHAPSTPRFVHAPTVCSPESPTPTAPWPGLSLWILLCGPWPRNDTLACVSPSPLALQETLEALSPERPPRSPPRSHRSRRRGFAAAAPGSGARPPDHPRFTRDLPRCTRDVPEVAREVSG